MDLYYENRGIPDIDGIVWRIMVGQEEEVSGGCGIASLLPYLVPGQRFKITAGAPPNENSVLSTIGQGGKGEVWAADVTYMPSAQ